MRCPTSGAGAVSGSMPLGTTRSGRRRYVVHVKPVGIPQPDYGARHVAALVLIVEPGSWNPRIDPGLVATTLGLTPAESHVAVGLAEGHRACPTSPRPRVSRKTPSIGACSRSTEKKSDLPAGGPGAVGAVNQRVRVTAALPASSLGGPVARPRAGSIPTHDYVPGTSNPGSDWTVLNALALAVLNTLAAGRGQPAEILYVLATDAQAFADFEMTHQEFVDALRDHRQ